MSDLAGLCLKWVRSPLYLELTTRQIALLAFVCDEDEPRSVGAIATQLNLSKPVVSRAVTVLEAAGFVRRQRGETDRRDVFILPTAAGQTIRMKIEML